MGGKAMADWGVEVRIGPIGRIRPIGPIRERYRSLSRLPLCATGRFLILPQPLLDIQSLVPAQGSPIRQQSFRLGSGETLGSSPRYQLSR
jgi:hypothetical protein